VTGHPLDADTALEPLTPTRWRGHVSERWWVVRGPFGGYLMVFLVRALLLAVGDPARRPRSLTVHFIHPPAAGPIEVCATVERAGRAATAVSLRLEQDGVPVALALGSCATWRDGEPEWAEITAPQAPPPEDCPRFGPHQGGPPFHERFEIRWVGAGEGEARNLAWLRADPPRALDHLALTALSDGWMPAAFSKLGRLVAAPTVDLTIHFRAPLVAPGDWVLADYRSRFSAGGTWEEDGELWAVDGTLLAQSRQLALIRDRR
jgi:acyl-CoA thioesterase